MTNTTMKATEIKFQITILRNRIVYINRLKNRFGATSYSQKEINIIRIKITPLEKKYYSR